MNRKYKVNKVNVPFNLPHIGEEELINIKKAHAIGQLSGDGFFTNKCQEWIERNIGCKKCFLTHSCTAAMDMIGILSGVGAGDEVILPSFTFSSTANAFLLRGAVPVFVDIRKDTLNIDENLIEGAITKRTKAIMVVHYAGVSCEMDVINRIARKYKLLVFEDAAQGILSRYKGKCLGALGNLGAFSFHETKNIISGEGGALLINDPKFIERAEIIRDCGTNKKKFVRGEIDKYSWVDIGSSYLPGELIAAFLLAQLKKTKRINKKRIKIWNYYYKNLEDLEKRSVIKCPFIPNTVNHNGHIFYLLTDNSKTRSELMEYLRKKGIITVFHYTPLHSSGAGLKYAKSVGSMEVTNDYSTRLVRLPLFYDMTISQADRVVKEIKNFYKNM